jgi:eukaryotic-like serine/threonine-protein kinase
MHDPVAFQAVLAEAVAARYALERELGRGGMATVFLARDLRDGRTVALKALHHLCSPSTAERFRREMEIAASLKHPGIVPLLDSGSSEGILYYVMPFVEGESLYARLERDRRVGLADALLITRDVAEAVAYAHGQGFLHRDLKPENILLTGTGNGDGRSHAVVADFGLARAIETTEHTRLTETGAVVGTIYYMSPEQLREERDLDVRTDVYSLGCVLYEMLTGGPPFTGRSTTDLVMRILRSPPPSARQVSPDVPPAVDAAIARALAKTAKDRFESMPAFAAALAA